MKLKQIKQRTVTLLLTTDGTLLYKTLLHAMEFSLNGFTEFAEFSDKKKRALWGWNPGSPV